MGSTFGSQESAAATTVNWGIALLAIRHGPKRGYRIANRLSGAQCYLAERYGFGCVHASRYGSTRDVFGRR